MLHNNTRGQPTLVWNNTLSQLCQINMLRWGMQAMSQISFFKNYNFLFFSQRILKRGLSIFKLLSYFLQPSILSKSCVVREYLGLPNHALSIIQSDWKLKRQSKQAYKKEQIILDTNQRLPLSEWLIFALDGVIWWINIGDGMTQIWTWKNLHY